MSETQAVPAAAAAYETRLVPIGDIVPSKNHRHYFDPQKLEELVESVKAHGVLEPLLVRMKKGKAELIAGERRLRAARAAKLGNLPCRVIDLNDVEVLEVQLVENLQREDIQPLDESGGFAALLEIEGYTVPMIAEKIGKNESYVYRRLRLAKLIPPLKKHLERGAITVAHADLLCPLDEKTQAAILEDFLFDRWRAHRGELAPVSPADLRAHLRDRILLQLSYAPWKKDDATLVPAAGACTTCTKRSGANLALFDDLKKGDDRCLDNACYAAKKTAFLVREISSASGKLIAIADGYQAPKDQPGIGKILARGDYLEAGAKPCKDMAKGIFVDGRRLGEKVKICIGKNCRTHNTSSGYGAAARRKPAEEWSRKREALIGTLTGKARSAAVDQIAAKVTEITPADARVLSLGLLNTLSSESEERLLQRLGLKLKRKSYEPLYWNKKAIAAIEAHKDQAQLLVWIALQDAAEGYGGYQRANKEVDALAAAAKVHGVNLAAIEARIKKTELAKFDEQRKAALAKKKAKPAKKGGAK